MQSVFDMLENLFARMHSNLLLDCSFRCSNFISLHGHGPLSFFSFRVVTLLFRGAPLLKLPQLLTDRGATTARTQNNPVLHRLVLFDSKYSCVGLSPGGELLWDEE